MCGRRTPLGGRGSSSASSRRPDLSKYVGSPSPYGDVSRKQGGVVFRAYKDGKLPSAMESQISMMYGRYVRGRYDSAVPTTDSNLKEVASRLRTTINALFAKDYRAAG